MARGCRVGQRLQIRRDHLRRISGTIQTVQIMIVIHIGLKKAGSASIQAFLSANSGALRNLSIDCPEVGTLGKAKGQHLNLYREIKGSRKFNPAFGTLRELQSYWEQCPGNVMVLSSETFEDVTAEQAMKIRDTFPSETFRIVIIIRNLIDLMPSSYAQKVKFGLKTYHFDKFFTERMHERRVNYLESAAQWAAVFGWENLHVRLLDRRHLLNGDLIDDFMAIIGLDMNAPAASMLTRPGIVNAAPGWKILEALRALFGGKHRLGKRHPLSQLVHPDLVSYQRKLIGLKGIEIGERYGWTDKGLYLTQSQALQCDSQFREAIEALNRSLKTGLPPPDDIGLRDFQPRDFMPKASRIPAEELRGFYDELGRTLAEMEILKKTIEEDNAALRRLERLRKRKQLPASTEARESLSHSQVSQTPSE
jgi:hypothetical protein